MLRRGSVKAVSPVPLRMVVDDKTEVREYFNNEGFNRWNKIYSESDDVNVVQKVPLACYNASVTFAHSVTHVTGA